jgi:Flp pilus assembly protein TadD
LPTSEKDLQRWQNAQQDLLKGRSDRALTAYTELLNKYPDSEKLWFELGLTAAKELEFDLADEAFKRTAELSPGNISLRVLLGQQYHLLRRMDKARTCFEQAAAMDPDSVHAQLSLADWYERERRLDDAWACVDACAARHPTDAQIRCYQALLRQRRKQFAEAETILRELVGNISVDLNVKYSCRHQLAVVLDETGRQTEALGWLAEAKAVLRQSANVARLEQTYEQANRRRRGLLAELTPEMIRSWGNEAVAAPNPKIAFLGGHPRSGTTLLEQILGAHPQISAFDEPIAFSQEILEQLAPMENGMTLTVEALNQLSEARRIHFRKRYLKNLGREHRAPTVDGLLLDKNPSHTASVHLWLRVFPKVKVIIALRDPRDVVVSCYMQNLMLNATNANFLSLERTVKHYADVMDVWLRLRELGGFDWIESRYEDIIADAEAEGRRVMKFLGLDWSPLQATHHEAARKQFVFSPNYNEVAQPVYQRATGRWRHYAEALAPFQERLAPYCRAFGYG